MSGERLTIGKDGLVTHIETGDQIVDTDYDYSLQPKYQLPSMSEDIGYHNIFSMSHDIDGKMRITGDDADIELNGISLKQTLDQLQERMAILQPNPELEKEFKELREIRQQYIQLEKNLLEKKEMWETLNKDN